jgi:catalase (peroxidase I)
MARAAIRLGFHDAGTWSGTLAAQGQDFGGADGSFVLYGEISRPENAGLEDINQFATDLWGNWNVNMGDLIQFMANHATVTCPLGPRTRTYIGRPVRIFPMAI